MSNEETTLVLDSTDEWTCDSQLTPELGIEDAATGTYTLEIGSHSNTPWSTPMSNAMSMERSIVYYSASVILIQRTRNNRLSIRQLMSLTPAQAPSLHDTDCNRGFNRTLPTIIRC